MPSYYLNQHWPVVNWTLRNKLQWNWNRNTKLFIHENAFESVAILFWGDELSSFHSYRGSWYHDDVIKWKHFPRYWPFVRGIHRWPVNSPHKGQWRGALMLPLIYAWINVWANNPEAGDLRRHGVTIIIVTIIIEAFFVAAEQQLR